MKCYNCVYYDESEQKCEAGREPEGCESYEEILYDLDLDDLDFLAED